MEFKIENGEIKGCVCTEDETEAVIPPEVTRLGHRTFAYSNLKKVIIQGDLTSFGFRAFEKSQVETVIFEGTYHPRDLEDEIRSTDEMFVWCYYLKEVKLPEGMTAIGDNAFTECCSLRSIVIPKSVEVLGNAFGKCSRLEEVEFLNPHTRIGPFCFSNCTALKRIELPRHCPSMGRCVFEGCTALEEVIFPEGMTTIPQLTTSVSEYFRLLPDINMACDADEFMIRPGKKDSTPKLEYALHYLAHKAEYSEENGKKNIAYIRKQYSKVLTEAIEQNDVAAVTEGLKIKQADLSLLDSLIEKAGKGGQQSQAVLAVLMDYKNTAYSRQDIEMENDRLMEAALDPSSPEAAKKVWRYQKDSRLKGIKLNKYIGEEEIVYVPERIGDEPVVKLCDEAFRGCKSIVEVKLPATLTIIGKSTFAQCENLKEVYIPGKLTTLQSYTFQGCKALTSVYLPDTLRTIEVGAFTKCELLAQCRIPEGVKVIGMSAFYGCTSLTQITIPKSVEKIVSYAFAETGLKEMRFLGKDTKISDEIFGGIDMVPMPGSPSLYKPVAPLRCTIIAPPGSSAIRLAQMFDFPWEEVEAVPIEEKTEEQAQSNRLAEEEERAEARKQAQDHMAQLLAKPKKLSAQARSELLLEAVLVGTAQDVKSICKAYAPFEFTAEALGYACRYRDEEILGILLKNKAKFWFSGGKSSGYNEYDLMLLLPYTGSPENTFDRAEAFGIPAASVKTRTKNAVFLARNAKRTTQFDVGKVMLMAAAYGELDIAEALEAEGHPLSSQYAGWLTGETANVWCGGDNSTHFKDVLSKMPQGCGLRCLKLFVNALKGTGKKLKITPKMMGYERSEYHLNGFYDPEALQFMVDYADLSKLNKTGVAQVLRGEKAYDALKVLIDAGMVKA